MVGSVIYYGCLMANTKYLKFQKISPVAGRRAANELAAEDAVAGLMALSNEQIQGAGVDNDSTAWFAG